MTPLISLFCFGCVVTLTVVLGVVDAREFVKREKFVRAAEEKAREEEKARRLEQGLRVVAGGRR